MSFAGFVIPEVADRNTTTLSNSYLDDHLEYTNSQSEDSETRLIEDVNASRYKIGGESAGSFITVFEEKGTDYKDAYKWVVNNP